MIRWLLIELRFLVIAAMCGTLALIATVWLIGVAIGALA